jgi:hypothetical protein
MVEAWIVIVAVQDGNAVPQDGWAECGRQGPTADGGQISEEQEHPSLSSFGTSASCFTSMHVRMDVKKTGYVKAQYSNLFTSQYAYSFSCVQHFSTA